MPAVIVFCFVGLMSTFGFVFYMDNQFTKDIIKFEQRCTGKGGLTLQAYKTGVKWVGCYKNGVELENEQ